MISQSWWNFHPISCILILFYFNVLIATKTVGVVNLIEANGSGTTGLLLLVQSSDSSEVTIRGRISQLSAGTHGFHVHTTGATGSNCGDAGGHFNPTNVSRN